MPTLIAIITCKLYAHRLKAQEKTWIPQVRAAGFDVQVFDGQRLGVSDDYLGLPAKTKALCRWAMDNGYTRLLKLDDDAYVWVDRLKVIEADYAGVHVSPNDGGHSQYNIPNFPPGHFPHPYASGGAYWLSEKSIKIIATANLTDDWAEDRWVGNTLAKNNIKLTHIDYGCSGHAVLSRKYAVCAQIPDGGVERIAKGQEPVFGAPTRHTPAPPRPSPPAPPSSSPARPSISTPGRPRIVRFIDRRRHR